jgi:hypothetical protein
MSKKILKVTDPTRKVKDPALLKSLTEQGVDKDYVELVQDYGKFVPGVSAPNARFYLDRKSGKRIVVFERHPMLTSITALYEV